MVDDSGSGTSPPGYGDKSDIHHIRHPPSSPASLSTTIVEAIADLANTAVADLDPLYDAIDPDALCEVVGSDGEDRSRSVGGVWFYYSGYEVTVYGSGDIEICDLGIDPDQAPR